MQVNILKIITKAINNVLVSNPLAMQELKANLAGTVVWVLIEDFAVEGYVVFGEHGVVLQKTTTKEVDVKVSGRLMALLGVSPLAKGTPPEAWPKAVSFAGDLAKIEKVRNWLKDLSIDWIAVFSPYLGECIAAGLVTTMHKGFGLFNTGASKIQQHTKNWVNDEESCLVAKDEVDDFLNSVDELRQRTDRLNAQLDFLQVEMNKDDYDI